jgi:multimeric flavodoxin WrbA
MKTLILNCTLKRSPADSNTAMLADEVVAGLEERGVECETLRLVDLNILPGVSSDEGGGDEWPIVRNEILASSIVILATPTWLGQMSSVAKRALERIDAMLSEQNEAGQMIAYNPVAGSVVTGNEDGAKHCVAEMQAAMTDIGFCAPPLAYTYWNMGPGPGPEYADTDHGKEWSKTTASTCAHNLYNVARALEERPIPPEEYAQQKSNEPIGASEGAKEGA